MIFDYAVDRERLIGNPMSGLKKTKERKRKRKLTDEEIGIVWQRHLRRDVGINGGRRGLQRRQSRSRRSRSRFQISNDLSLPNADFGFFLPMTLTRDLEEGVKPSSAAALTICAFARFLIDT
jgi:hypothetical protein